MTKYSGPILKNQIIELGLMHKGIIELSIIKDKIVTLRNTLPICIISRRTPKDKSPHGARPANRKCYKK